jgi:hypothetical protein
VWIGSTCRARCRFDPQWAVAFVVLVAAEFSLAGLAFGRSTVEYVASYGSAPGAIGLATQIVFATSPIVQVWRR